MRRITVVLAIIVMLVGWVGAQQKSPVAKSGAKKAAPAAHSATSATSKPETSDALPTEATVKSFLKNMFSYDSTISYQVLSIRPSRASGIAEVLVNLKSSQGENRGLFYVLPDRKYAIAGGDLIPFGEDPFEPARAALAAGTNGVVRGPANAVVTVVEFSDLECPACKAAQPTIDRLIGDEPDVKFVFQNFPLEKLHPWSFLGATYADCVARQSGDAFWKFIGSVYQNQDAITALLPSSASSSEDAIKQGQPAIANKLQDLAGQAGANPTQVAICATEPATAERVRESMKFGETMDVTGTPTIFVHGRRIQNVSGLPYEVLKAMVDASKTLAKAGD